MNTTSQSQKWTRFLLVVTALFGVFGAPIQILAEEASVPVSAGVHYFMCKLHGDVRTIRMHRDKDSVESSENCRVEYTKGGRDKVVARAKATSFCESKMDELKATLEKSGWACRDISQTVIHRDDSAPAATGSVNAPAAAAPAPASPKN